jgi:hypothetical protein
VCNGTKPPSTYIYSWWFRVGTFVNYELQCWCGCSITSKVMTNWQ